MGKERQCAAWRGELEGVNGLLDGFTERREGAAGVIHAAANYVELGSLVLPQKNLRKVGYVRTFERKRLRGPRARELAYLDGKLRNTVAA